MKVNIPLLSLCISIFFSCSTSINTLKIKGTTVKSKSGRFQEVIIRRYSPGSYQLLNNYGYVVTTYEADEFVDIRNAEDSFIEEALILIMRKTSNDSFSYVVDSLENEHKLVKLPRKVNLLNDTTLLFKQRSFAPDTDDYLVVYSKQNYTLQDLFLPNHFYRINFYTKENQYDKNLREFIDVYVDEKGELTMIDYKINEIIYRPSINQIDWL
tara:strand:- start:9625 stop:10260 length:636 start_codon:yes stop_codon:yes gene_type:complete